jgi:hypothetical protein
MTLTSVQQPYTPSSSGYRPPPWGDEERVVGLGVEAGFWGPRIGICAGL